MSHHTSTTSLPYFMFPELWWWLLIPKTHKHQSIQQPKTPCRSDRSTLNTSATQTQPFQTNQVTQTFPQQNTQAIQTDLGLNENLTHDSTNSSTSTDILDEVVSINKSNSNRKRKTHKDHISNKSSSTKERKKVSFPQDQQNSSELLDNNIINDRNYTYTWDLMNNNLKLFKQLKLLELCLLTSRGVNKLFRY